MLLARTEGAGVARERARATEGKADNTEKLKNDRCIKKTTLLK
jgi:hypothetical protein